ncbi:MAG: ribosome maturation factor RimP [Deltaproteobacteria bacterium]|nr:ribosome maturation factor RimP [Deltaproteobacteria bacterium]
MQSRRQTINEEVSRLVGPVLEASGLELVDVEYTSDYGRRVLRLYVDRSGGVTLEDCARASREVGDLIDVKDIIDDGYVLEVSSPGLNRPLKKEKDFLRVLGKKIKVIMAAPVEGRRKFTGTLKFFEGGVLGLEIESGLVDLHWSDVEKANLVYDFK